MSQIARKTVTIVFTDVTGSTSLGEQLDPEALRDVMARYFETAKRVLEQHGGVVEKFIGDAVMAVFGMPNVHEDDALRAVRAAADLRDAVARLNQALENERGVSIEVRTGVNTGEVVVGDPGEQQFYATGDAVNVAARLEQAAAPGEIVVGDLTRRLVRQLVDLEPAGSLALKGKGQDVQAWRLTEVHESRTAIPRSLDRPLVGRRSELAALMAAFAESRASKTARLCTVVGAPGIGKSRLANELALRLGDEANVVAGRCLSYGEGITYWPLIEIWRQASGLVPLADVVPGRPREILEALLGRADATLTTEETFWAVRKAFEALAATRPLVVVVDDMHWAEPTFLDMLEHVLEFAADASLVLVALARPEFLETRPLWSMEREWATLIRLEPLDLGESEALLEALHADLPEALRRRIDLAAGGNPLFIEQMLAMLEENGDGHDEVSAPPTVQALLAARIDGLAPEERAVVEPAAVIGQEFWREAVASLCPEIAVSPVLQRLMRKDFIGRVRSSFVEDDAFAFRHILIREAAYASIPKSRRADLHEHFANWLEAASPEFQEIIGYHLEQAAACLADLGPAGERQRQLARRATKLLGTAGRRAWERGDAHAAISLLERALLLLPDGDHRPTEVVVALGGALEAAGRIEDASRLLSEAADQAATAGSVQDEVRFLIEDGLVRFAHGSSLDAADPLVGRALAVFEESGDHAGLAATWHLACYPGWTALRWQEAASAVERALEHARLAGDAVRTERAASWLMMAYTWGPTPVEQAKPHVEALIAGSDPVSRLRASGLTFLGWLVAMTADLDRGRALYREGIDQITEFGIRIWRGGRSVMGGEIELLAGDPIAAEAELRAGYDTLMEIGEKGVLSTVAFSLAEAVYQQARFAEADELSRLSEAAADGPDISSQVGWRNVRAKLLAQQGDHSAAERVSGEALELIARTDAISQQADTFVSRSEVFQLAGRSVEASSLLEKAIRLYEAKGMVPAVRMARRRRVALAR